MWLYIVEDKNNLRCLLSFELQVWQQRDSFSRSFIISSVLLENYVEIYENEFVKYVCV